MTFGLAEPVITISGEFPKGSTMSFEEVPYDQYEETKARLKMWELAPEKLSVEGNTYYLEDELGYGGYGSVYSMTSTCGEKIALKLQKALNEKSVQSFQNEVSIWKQLKHRNIIKLLGHKEDYFAELTLLMMEHAGYGDLFSFIDKYEDRTPSVFRHRIACQLIDALAYMHRSGFVHCDVKPENVIFTELATVKICDFGAARRIYCDGDGMELKQCIRKGTTSFLTPEKYYGIPSYSTKDDVWALGMTLLYLALGYCPWDAAAEDDQQYQLWKIEPTRLPQYVQIKGEEPTFFELLRNMLHPVEDSRWTMAESTSSYYIRESHREEGYPSKKCLKRRFKIMSC
ncbi:hypothetical protein QR680_005958 [Steinernema hermaphroditum]|uniref:Protein kinase domain-containing protein n=1 Tax=Steinernema hermaphroditum TaxID=289476 RepID=A0AA39HUY5_9BILA|nr:hypothetical protein QR680_005958 [Steinernema hermaphroditum]